MSPEQNNCIPAKKVIIHASDGQPLTGSPKTSARIKSTQTAINATAQKNNPIAEDQIKGAVEKATIPSME